MLHSPNFFQDTFSHRSQDIKPKSAFQHENYYLHGQFDAVDTTKLVT